MRIFKSILCGFGALLLAALLGLSLKAAVAGQPQGANFAFIIGVGQYENWTSLPTPMQDALALARVLEQSYGFARENITVLTDDSPRPPTRNQIHELLESFAARLGQNDNLLIFFSGHGVIDEDGESYWIPSDGKYATKINWLKHSDLVKEYFASPAFAARNILILSDTLFSEALFDPKPLLLTAYDLRYKEKIRELAAKKGRLVIALAEKPDPQDNALSLGRLIEAALLENPLEVIDVETLLFADFSGEGKAAQHLNLVSGRLATPLDQDGSLVFTQVHAIPTPVVEIVRISPSAPVPGQQVVIEAKTDIDAQAVEIFINNRAFDMEGEGRTWTIMTTAPDSEPADYSITAYNAYAHPGPAHAGEIALGKALASLVEIASAVFSPEKGTPGQATTLEVTTSSQAKSVSLTIFDKTLAMSGGGIRFSGQILPPQAGEHSFSIVALNEDGKPGPALTGILTVEAPLVRIAEVGVSPQSGDSGKTFVVSARTDRPARAVDLLVGNSRYSMQGEGTNWRIERPFAGQGSLMLRVVAANEQGRTGPPGQTTLSLRSSSQKPDVASVAVNPRTVQTREPFTITATLAAPAREASITIIGQTLPMQGGPSSFTHTGQIDEEGRLDYTIAAISEKGEAGLPYSGVISVIRRPVQRVSLDRVSATPDPVSINQAVQFVAHTSGKAQSVIIDIDGDQFPMNTDNGLLWTLHKSFSAFGPKPYNAWALSEDVVKSNEIAGAVMVRAPIVEVVRSYLEPRAGIRPGEDVIVTAITDRPAAGAEVRMGDQVFAMEGGDRNWTFKTLAPQDLGADFRIEIRARNEEGRFGPPIIWTITY
jgi:hypothetical protein